MTSNTYNYSVIENSNYAGTAFPTGTTILGLSLYKPSINTQEISLYISMSKGAENAMNPTSKPNAPLTENPSLKIVNTNWNFQKVSTITLPPVSIIPRNSTYLGANITYSSAVNTSNSTAIGYGANIDVSNQIVLGTSGEFVCIPSNRGLSIGKTTAPLGTLDISGNLNIISGVAKLSHTNALTTITNTNIDVSGNLNATSYRVGTNSSSVPLLSHMMPIIWRVATNTTQLANQTQSYNTSFSLGTELSFPSVYGSAQDISFPFGLIPHGCSAHYDNGAFNGGSAAGTMSYKLAIYPFNSTMTPYGITSSTPISTSSGTAVGGVGGGAYLTFNNAIRIPPNTKIWVMFTLTNTTAITAITKSVQFNIYSQQVS
jgi:hypothetical protein